MVKASASTTSPKHIVTSSSLYHIDVLNKKLSYIDISNATQDLELFLYELIAEIDQERKKRSYSFNSKSTDFYKVLKDFHQSQKIQNSNSSYRLSTKLLNTEIDTDKRYGHLGEPGKGHVKKGSFLQILYKTSGIQYYLGIKIEHQTFLDEKDFTRRIGLAVAKKIFKACKVKFDSSGTPTDVEVFDTNSTPSTYWHYNFLELAEVRNDTYNTRTASAEVIKVVNKIKKKFPADHTILRNSTVAAFKQKTEMDYHTFIEKAFRNYEPVDSSLSNGSVEF